MKDIFFEELEKINPEQRAFLEKNIAITERIYDLLAQKGYTQKDLAKKLGKHESEVSKWLSGMHNFTLNSLIKLEQVLEGRIVEIFSSNVEVKANEVKKRKKNKTLKILNS